MEIIQIDVSLGDLTNVIFNLINFFMWFNVNINVVMFSMEIL